jgi:hypothetical protein
MSENDKWEAVVTGSIGIFSLLAAKPSTCAPVRMRKRDENGNWIYRDPTQKEIEDYIASEAW